MKILIIIPAYNESKNISNVVKQIEGLSPNIDYLIINDCSNDDTEAVCKINNFNYITLPVNLGIGGGVQAGYKYALANDYEIVIQMDGDGQHDAAFIKPLIEPIIEDQADIVIGSRFITGKGFQSSSVRRMGINFISLLIKLCSGIKIKDVTSGFRAVNKTAIEIYAKEYSQDYPEPEAIICGAINNARILEVPVVMHERISGKSSINVWKSVYYMIKVSLAIIIYRFTFQKRR